MSGPMSGAPPAAGGPALPSFQGMQQPGQNSLPATLANLQAFGGYSPHP